MWGSYGFATEFLAYLFHREWIELQLLNRFTYDIFIARVKTRIGGPTPKLFIQWFAKPTDEFKNAIVRVVRLCHYTANIPNMIFEPQTFMSVPLYSASPKMSVLSNG